MAADSHTLAYRLYVLPSIVTVVAALYLAQDLLVPVALAVFLSFLLAPLATRLERLGMGRIPGALASIGLAAAIFIGVGFLITEQFIALAYQMPRYEDNIRGKLQAVQRMSVSILSRTQSVRGLTDTLATSSAPGEQGAPPAMPGGSPVAHRSHLFRGADESAVAAPMASAEKPVPVQIVQPREGPLAFLGKSLNVILGPLGTAGVVSVLAVFILIQRRDLRDRLIALTGRGHISLTTQAFDEMSRRISRYLLMQLVVNSCYGIPVGIGLALFGIPNALLWGLLALILRFVPYVGALTTAAVSILLAVAVYPGWWGPVGVLLFFVALEAFVNNVVEPWLYSVGTGVSVLGVILAAVFWAWLWGPVGLLLATPITVVLTVMGRYIPQLEFLDVLLGGQATLEPQFRLFQRLLAMDRAEAMEVAEQFRRDHGLLGLYDGLIVPALQLSEQDRHSGRVDEAKEVFIYRAFREIIDECAERDLHPRLPSEARATESPVAAGANRAVTEVAPSVSRNTRIVCLPAGDEADELAGLMFSHLLRAQGYQVDTASVEYLSGELLAEVEQMGAQIVCISALPPGALVAARYLCKRISLRWPKLPILVGLWNASENARHARGRLESCGEAKVVTSYGEAIVDTARTAQALRITVEA
jgi:predicted PurR-regulated permease PerM